MTKPMIPMTILLATAKSIAHDAHRKQREESSGEPYIRHVERVVALVATDEERLAAWLHDVVEDNPAWTLERLAERGVPVPTIAAVNLLTRRPDQTYAHYIDNLALSENDVAIAVKIADLKDHLRDTSRERVLPEWSKKMATLRPRYEKALFRLTTEWQPR